MNSKVSLTNSKFLDKIIVNPKKLKSSEVSNLLNSLLTKVYEHEKIGNVDNIDFTILDENQIWAYIENISKNPINNFKKLISTEKETNENVLHEVKSLKNSLLNEKRNREKLNQNKDEEEGEFDEENDEQGEEDAENGEDNDDNKGEELEEDDESFDQEEFDKIGDHDFDFDINEENEEEGDELEDEEGVDLQDPKDLTFSNFFGKVEKSKSNIKFIYY